MLATIMGLMMAMHSPLVLAIPVEAAPDPKVEWMSALAQCESHASTTVKVLDVNGYFSYGKYQYQMKTWLKYKKLGTTRTNVYDEDLQDIVTRHILDNDGQDNWFNCARIVTKSLGVYP